MRSKLTLFLVGTAVALSTGTAAVARDHNHRRDDGRHQREERGDHGRPQRDHGPRFGEHRDDRHGRPVWSHDRPRAHYYAAHRPPPRRFEHHGRRPGPHHLWISGSWRWHAGYTDWVWVPGYWDLPPYAGYAYVEPRYVDEGRRVVYVDGGWCEPTYANDGAASGAILGGIAGGIIGHQSKHTGAGIVAGAVVGSIIGHEVDADRAERRAVASQPPVTRVVVQNGTAVPVAAATAVDPQPTDPELAAAQERARTAKAKLAAAKQAQQTADSRTEAIRKANAEADAAEAELRALEH